MSPSPRLTTWAAATAIAIAALAGCTSSGDDVETRTEAEATRIVQQKADQVVTLIGRTSLTDPAISPGPCTGKAGENSGDVFAVQGVWVLPLPEQRHLDTLTRLRDAWKAEGYTITTDQTVGTGGELTAKANDGSSINVITTDPPNAMRLLIHSACYESPTPRN
jgi:hypothetical protein